jgi:hypothetical protein
MIFCRVRPGNARDMLVTAGKCALAGEGDSAGATEKKG